MRLVDVLAAFRDALIDAGGSATLRSVPLDHNGINAAVGTPGDKLVTPPLMAIPNELSPMTLILPLFVKLPVSNELSVTADELFPSIEIVPELMMLPVNTGCRGPKAPPPRFSNQKSR